MSRKKIFFGLGIFVLLSIAGILILNWYIVKELKKELEKSETTALYEYEDITFNILTGNASALQVIYKNDNLEVRAEKVFLQELSYLDYLTQGKFQIGDLEILKPVILYREKQDVSEDTVQINKEDSGENIRITRLTLTDGILQIMEKDSTSENLFLKFNRIDLKEVQSNKNIRQENLPFEYQDFEMESDSLIYNLNEEHLLLVKSGKFKAGSLEVKNLNIKPKFSVSEFDRRIAYEKDRIDLEVQLLVVNDLKWDIVRDTLTLLSPVIKLGPAHLEVYRNKLLPDDHRIKPLYSKMMRNLGVKLNLDSINVEDLKIIYKEKVQEGRAPGELVFSDVQAVLQNFSNMTDSTGTKKTKIYAETLFMNKAPLTMELEFDVQAPNDEFHVSGRMGAVKAETLNPFLKPTMNVETEGVIKSLYYDFYGNRISAEGNMKLSYERFKVNILKKGNEEKKSFLSGLANLFIKNDALNEEVNQENLEVERNQTKSFWNFLWLCIREGAIKALI